LTNKNKQIYNNHMMKIQCGECGGSFDVDGEHSLIDKGLYLTPRMWGYYGGFTDNNPWEEVRDREEINLCHDCCLRLMRAFPSIARAMGEGGHHPCSTDEPCCEFAWRCGETPDGKDINVEIAALDKESNKIKWVPLNG
jgi:hypothetical protein